MFVPQYDEFGIYTTIDEIESFVENLLLDGTYEIIEIYCKCIDIFGYKNCNIIKSLIYG